jgi:hypothetical protein
VETPARIVSGPTHYLDGNIVWGSGPIRPIVNLPAGVLKWRIRQRSEEITKVFLRFVDRIEQWDIEDAPEGWRLTVCVASNSVRIPSSEIPVPK